VLFDTKAVKLQTRHNTGAGKNIYTLLEQQCIDSW